MIARGFLLSLLLLAGCRENPAAPPERNTEHYPLETGARWEYRSAIGLKVGREIKRTLHENNRDWHEMIFTLPLLGDRTLLMRHSSRGIIARRNEREQMIMRFPMKKGDSWTIDFPGEDLAICTVEAPEELVILDRHLTCSKLRVERRDRESGKTTRDFEWYAEGIGLVQMTVTVMKVTQTFTLASYKAPEATP